MRGGWGDAPHISPLTRNSSSLLSSIGCHPHTLFTYSPSSHSTTFSLFSFHHRSSSLFTASVLNVPFLANIIRIFGRIKHWHLRQGQSGGLIKSTSIFVVSWRVGMLACLLFYAFKIKNVEELGSFSPFPKMAVRENYWVGSLRDLHGIRQCQSKGWMKSGLHKGRHTVGSDPTDGRVRDYKFISLHHFWAAAKMCDKLSFQGVASPFVLIKENPYIYFI